MSLVDRVREALRRHQSANALPNAVTVSNRSEARRLVRGVGPYQHFTVEPASRERGRSQRKRNEARERAL